MWDVKGRYNDAIADDDDVDWTFEDGKYVIRILAVSFSFYLLL